LPGNFCRFFCEKVSLGDGFAVTVLNPELLRFPCAGSAETVFLEFFTGSPTPLSVVEFNFSEIGPGFKAVVGASEELEVGTFVAPVEATLACGRMFDPTPLMGDTISFIAGKLAD
jgi:hypothetical protein